MLITDLDNTLYDWVTYFSKSFEAMVTTLSSLINVDLDLLFDEFKLIHQKYGNSEQPFAILELPSVQKAFPNRTRQELLNCLHGPLAEFNSTRSKYLKLYDSVLTTLQKLTERGVQIVGYTDAFSVNSYYRLKALKIEPFFSKLYASDGMDHGHPNLDRGEYYKPPHGFLSVIPKNQRKPDPQVLMEIWTMEQVQPTDVVYIGDSLTKDILMANQAGVTSVWAKYGTQFDPAAWATLVKITHWTQEDVVREEKLRRETSSARPDYIVERFEDVIEVLGL